MTIPEIQKVLDPQYAYLQFEVGNHVEKISGNPKGDYHWTVFFRPCIEALQYKHLIESITFTVDRAEHKVCPFESPVHMVGPVKASSKTELNFSSVSAKPTTVHVRVDWMPLL